MLIWQFSCTTTKIWVILKFKTVKSSLIYHPFPWGHISEHKAMGGYIRKRKKPSFSRIPFPKRVQVPSISPRLVLVLQKLFNSHVLLLIWVISRCLFIASACAEATVSVWSPSAPLQRGACTAPSTARVWTRQETTQTLEVQPLTSE